MLFWAGGVVFESKTARRWATLARSLRCEAWPATVRSAAAGPA